MPELPEVETMVRGIRPSVEGRVISAMKKCRCPCKPITMNPTWPRIVKRVVGQRVVEVTRIAKRAVFQLSSGDAIVIEPRMTGLLLLNDPPDRGHLRVRWDFEHPAGDSSLWFWDRRGLGTLSLYSAAELSQRLAPPHLGVDALKITPRQWKVVCGKTKRAIKVALLDQKFVAGIGNLYASEILHRAGIHPQQPADELTQPQIQRMANATRTVLRTAIEHEGSTLSDGTYRNALNQNGSYQNSHRVYQRAEEFCPNCRETPVQRIVQGQRSTFFCPACQPLR
ncbi:Formamidopyrimidine-DNA glycosylase [Symmachiella macrocystis]|uniref:Formamidopyrimidine-DNA glycosylase n=1 Tax=Symmachiella macrocystis TaxID=2527985 RepID=A0A5C6BLW0_9PLAN|nr:bifunctional DNA-formamidopyrimidine glycosylase/DNA-(apurinic or apyrimidinic site) lyase [Symmachiella macrocystis]TWU12286.1 Formamidopyrimidine-DNA glycosylase [Symmachiella macrocystis]